MHDMWILIKEGGSLKICVRIRDILKLRHSFNVCNTKSGWVPVVNRRGFVSALYHASYTIGCNGIDQDIVWTGLDGVGIWAFWSFI